MVTPKHALIMANREDPDEMQYKAAFNQGLHCLLRQIRSKKIFLYFLEIKPACIPSIHTMDKPDLTVSNLKETSIGFERVKFKAYQMQYMKGFCDRSPLSGLTIYNSFRLAPVLKTIFRQCVISHTCT